MLFRRLYWDTKDVLSYLAAETDDEYIKKVLAQGKARTATDEDVKASIQGSKSVNKEPLKFENVKTTPGGHRIQVIEELQTVPVSLTTRPGWVLGLIEVCNTGHDRCRRYQVATRDPMFGCLAFRFRPGIGTHCFIACAVRIMSLFV